MTAAVPACQYCGTSLTVTWIDLGSQPLANDYAPSAQAARAKTRYPLHARACPNCWLVQVDRVVAPEDIFSHYAYFSSYSDSWLEHCRLYAEKVTERFGLGTASLVIEIASNDGYLLKHFKNAGVKVLGIDPAANVAQVARDAGIPTEVEFFGASLAQALVDRGCQADHLSAKNVLAHVPDIGDFVRGVKILLRPDAVFTVEFPHLLETMQKIQFDQIYHEHFTYLSLVAIERVMIDHGLRVFDLETLDTHGGSLRLFVCHAEADRETSEAVGEARDRELDAGLDTARGYAGFDQKIARIRQDFLSFVASVKDEGKSVAGYGAAAKGNTFLNYCGADADTLAFIADRSAAKTGKYMPSSAIAIVSPKEIDVEKPDYLLILPWNLTAEIARDMGSVRDWGGQFVTAIPEIAVF